MPSPRAAASSRRAGLQHRPLQALADRPSGPLDAAAAGLWEAHRRRMEAAARRLRIGLPHAGFAARDPWGLRAVLAILLLLGAIDAGSDWRDRLVRSVDARYCRQVGDGRREPRHLGDAARVHRAGAAIPARRERRKRCASRPAASCSPRCMAAGGAAPRDRRGEPRFRCGRQAELPGRGDLDDRQAARGDAGGHGARQLADRDHPGQPAHKSPSQNRPKARRMPRCASIIRRATITGSNRPRR